MLPERAYAGARAPVSDNARAQPPPPDSRQALIVVARLPDVDLFPSAPYARFDAGTTVEAIRLIGRWHPRVLAIDWDADDFDATAICGAAQQKGPVAVLAVMRQPERAPAALKAGCHSILLKPFQINLAAARLGRLVREMPAVAAASRLGTLQQWGTNRTWCEMTCPRCGEGNAVGFEHASHRRSWYACLACEHVWLGVRRE
jgi:CheY-like chemotaxis protein